MIDPVIKQAWVEALRSGDYDQTDCVLYYEEEDPETHLPENDCYCALGVLLAVVYGEEEVINNKRGYRDVHDMGMTDQEVSMVIEWNDSEHMPFEDIADLVEKFF